MPTQTSGLDDLLEAIRKGQQGLSQLRLSEEIVNAAGYQENDLNPIVVGMAQFAQALMEIQDGDRLDVETAKKALAYLTFNRALVGIADKRLKFCHDRQKPVNSGKGDDATWALMPNFVAILNPVGDQIKRMESMLELAKQKGLLPNETTW